MVMFTLLYLAAVEGHVPPRCQGSLLPVPTGAREKTGRRENLGKILPNFALWSLVLDDELHFAK